VGLFLVEQLPCRILFDYPLLVVAFDLLVGFSGTFGPVPRRTAGFSVVQEWWVLSFSIRRMPFSVFRPSVCGFGGFACRISLGFLGSGWFNTFFVFAFSLFRP